MNAEEIVQLNREYSFFSWSAQGKVDPIPVKQAKGVYFWDQNGKRYMDFCSQLMNVNLGHSHPKVIQAIKNQADQLLFIAPQFATQVRGELGRMLADITPGDLKKTMFTLGGAEANENAIKIARMVTGRHKIVTRYRSYHGATYGALTAGGDPRRLAVEPGISGIVRVLDPYCYRCPFGQRPEKCRRECLDHVEQVILFEGPENVAAILMEGVTGTNGLFVPPDDYWPRMREVCDKYGILLISDEVMSGFGRTGAWFGINHWNVVPDMITMAKGLASGYLPLGAVTVSEKVADYFEEHTFWGGLTCSGHAMCCAAAIATIKVYQEENLIEHAREMGDLMKVRLNELHEHHPSVGDVRGMGLFWVIELVRERDTRAPLVPWNAPADLRGPILEIARYLRDNGLYTFTKWNWIFIVPPLPITSEQIEEGLGMIDGALTLADKSR
ncbi:MAG: aminotransferase class III-fold pyridoxal phosphate-dependent enzyme [Chloroflexota bacterium]